MANQNWLCLQTMSGKECALATRLQQLGVSSYAPRYKKSYIYQQHIYNTGKGEYEYHPRQRTSIFSFFPTYIFTTNDYYESWLNAKWLIGMPKSHVVGEVEEGFVELLQEKEVDGFILTAKDRFGFNHGDDVIINSSTYRDIAAIFLEHSPEKDRIRVLMQMLGGQREVQLNYSDIQITRPVYA